MPIKIDNNLPAVKTLNDENIFVMAQTRAVMQDIRPLKLLLLNLMPDKITTETQIARLVSNTPLQVELELLHMASHQSKNTAAGHIQNFYQTFDAVKDRKFDGLIITGAPVERYDFEDVDYWAELTEIMDWSRTHVYSTIHTCWAAQAGLYHHFGIAKKPLPKKISGVFPHRVTHAGSILFRGSDDEFFVPHSRYTTLDEAAVLSHPELKVLAASDEAGLYAISTDNGKQIFLTGHPEYDAMTLDKEYRRDLAVGLNPDVPCNYYKNDDPSEPPLMRWRAHAHLVYANWLNYFVYQETPYDLEALQQQLDANG